jgi:hypothetical protein
VSRCTYGQAFIHNLLVHLNCGEIDAQYVPTHGHGTVPSTTPHCTSRSRNRRAHLWSSPVRSLLSIFFSSSCSRTCAVFWNLIYVVALLVSIPCTMNTTDEPDRRGSLTKHQGIWIIQVYSLIYSFPRLYSFRVRSIPLRRQPPLISVFLISPLYFS